VTYRTTEMPCPECGAKLDKYEDRDKWRCPACNGALVGTSELELEAAATAEPTFPPRACPQCQRAMFGFAVADLTLDRCATCHLVWFDRGELGRLRTALAEPVEDWAVRWATLTRFAL
jgi:Zn-finger nucleic acid-binding protein